MGTMRKPAAFLAFVLIAFVGIALLWKSDLRVRSFQEQAKSLDPAQVLVLRTPGGYLEVATLVKTEEFRWRSSYTCLGQDCGSLLGERIGRIRVPVHYTYRIALAAQWTLKLEGDAYVLRVPAPEPRVRSGVWNHSSFRTQPLQRLQRTGLAAMVTVYGARSVAEAMIAGVVRRHEKITGRTPAGEPYGANDPELLGWVQATAGYGFAQAYHAYVRPLRPEEFDRLCLEGAPSARLYGAVDAPTSQQEMQALFETMRARLEPSPIVQEFLQIMASAPILPAPLRSVQRLLVRAAVEITPPWVRERLGLAGSSQGLGVVGKRFVRWAGWAADRLVLPESPAAQACRRLGLPADYLVTGSRGR
jgi:uncharacterized protein (DUF2236 family)